jgi:hypothetical protein
LALFDYAFWHWIFATFEVSNAVPAIWSTEVQHIIARSLMFGAGEPGPA